MVCKQVTIMLPKFLCLCVVRAFACMSLFCLPKCVCVCVVCVCVFVCMQVTIMFADCVGFTSMSKEVKPVQVMRFLHELYKR